MRQYHDLLKYVLGRGEVMFEPRTQVYTIGLSGSQSVYDLREGFPLMTTKKINHRLPFEELLWKLRGERSIKSLFDRNVHIWDENAFQHYLERHNLVGSMPKHSEEWEAGFEDYKNNLANREDAKQLGDLGPVYGYQWRYGFKRYGEAIDQLANVIENVRKNSNSRYHVMTAWNPSDLPDSALGPCPMVHHFNVNGNYIDLHVFQRSCDLFLGVPFNIAQDSLLTHLIARETKLKPRYFVHTYSNAHIYLGVSPRAEFWNNTENVENFQRRIKGIEDRKEYLRIREWYLKESEKEKKLDKGKDHIPFVLTQLSKEPKKLPTIVLKNICLWAAIRKKAEDVATIIDYSPHTWKSKARMAV